MYKCRIIAALCLVSTSIFFLCSCDSEPGSSAPPPPSATVIGKASAWLTTGDKGRLLNKESDVSITVPLATAVPVITINATEQLQEMEGFGAALTGSSAYLIRKLPSGQRTALIQELFDPQAGIGISYLRVTMGASDFSLEDYTYNDLPSGETDFDLSEFSIAKDDDVIAVLKLILAVNPNIKIMGTPWSPPAWMKTNGSLKHVQGQANKLKSECYEVYAKYFVKYIQAYAAEGIMIDAVTPQNEPLYSTASYPCLSMEATEQISFIKNHLGPAFEAAGINTKIIAYDHNWDNTNYAISVLNDDDANKYIAGSAFHAYAGDVSAMSVVHNAHPDKGLYFTEISGGEWATDFSENLQWNMNNIFIGTAKNWSKTALMWNLALDENFGPTNNGCSDCRGVITISGTAVSRNVEYYSIGHFSKFVGAGAHRIASSTSATIGNADHVAFRNTDGSFVLVVNNNDSGIKSFSVKQGNAQFTYSISGKSVVTITWKL
jgi:glucosylceramidase